jgi:hypothetical protein
MIQALTFSFLARQFASLQEGFVRRYPRPWLVWEAGRWNAPQLQASPADTVTPPPDLPGSSFGREPLFFQLPSGEFGAAVISIGRAPTNTIVINDATVSRQHVLLSERPSSGWWIEVSAEAKFVQVQDQRVEPGGKAALPFGATLHLGGVVLTFHSSDDFLPQLKAAVDAK